MKKVWKSIVAMWVILSLTSTVQAQIPIAEVIKEGIKKVILAVDLKVQRLQNKTIWLQNAQKELENTLSATRLDDISGWVEKQKDLYGNYFDELGKVKDAIKMYHRVKEIGEKQVAIVTGYKTAYGLFRQDPHFTATELEYMATVYSGMLAESMKNIDQLSLVVNAMTIQMSDEQRIGIINAAGDAIDKVYNDLRQFNNESRLLSLHRSKDAAEAAVVSTLYGLK
ncbi:MAG: conjugal transfer protein TraI [Williamsia sp.]|nr:conjugal transfer protein TraI [Williamsia sp.]